MGKVLKRLPPDFLKDPCIVHVLDTFMDKGEKITVKSGSVLSVEGTVSNYSYVVIEGEVVSTRVSVDGNQRYFWDSMLSDRDPFVCIPSVISEKPLSVSIVAKKQSVLYRISSRDFNKMMDNDGTFAAGAARILAAKFMRKNADYQELSETEPRYRFYKFLDRISHEYGEVIGESIIIKLPVTHQAAAEYLGVDRTTIFRAYRSLNEKGILDCVDNCYIIKDIERFNKVCAESRVER